MVGRLIESVPPYCSKVVLLTEAQRNGEIFELNFFNYTIYWFKDFSTTLEMTTPLKIVLSTEAQRNGEIFELRSFNYII
ncbi:hypothetical protein EV200_107187 [Pedobacter psychrotolerans]|nr:hypothetical protein EV200_107187 [Pedobacter psychrotolerans]